MVQHPYDDANVITAQVANHMVYQMLIDNESSFDVLYESAFDVIGFKRKILKPVRTPLMGFARENAFLEGSIQRLFTVGEAPNRSTIVVNFLMIKSPFAYNAILGRPTLNALRAATSTYHLMIKFLTKKWRHRLGTWRSIRIQKCYATTLCDKNAHS